MTAPVDGELEIKTLLKAIEIPPKLKVRLKLGRTPRTLHKTEGPKASEAETLPRITVVENHNEANTALLPTRTNGQISTPLRDVTTRVTLTAPVTGEFVGKTLLMDNDNPPKLKVMLKLDCDRAKLREQTEPSDDPRQDFARMLLEDIHAEP